MAAQDDMMRIALQTARPRTSPSFRDWYLQNAAKLGLNPNPDDPRHRYDYRAAFRSGAEPDSTGHWPSEFKADDHPSRYMRLNGVMTDTKSGAPASIEPGGVEYSDPGYQSTPMTASEKIMAVVYPLLGALQGIGAGQVDRRTGRAGFGVGQAAQGVAGGLAMGLGGPARRRAGEREAYEQGQQQDFENTMRTRADQRAADAASQPDYGFQNVPGRGMYRTESRSGAVEPMPGTEPVPAQPLVPGAPERLSTGAVRYQTGPNAYTYDLPPDPAKPEPVKPVRLPGGGIGVLKTGPDGEAYVEELLSANPAAGEPSPGENQRQGEIRRAILDLREKRVTGNFDPAKIDSLIANLEAELNGAPGASGGAGTTMADDIMSKVLGVSGGI